MKNKPVLEIIGTDGNSFSILGKASRVAKKNGWSESEIKDFLEKAMSGDYNNLLRVVNENFEVE